MQNKTIKSDICEPKGPDPEAQLVMLCLWENCWRCSAKKARTLKHIFVQFHLSTHSVRLPFSKVSWAKLIVQIIGGSGSMIYDVFGKRSPGTISPHFTLGFSEVRTWLTKKDWFVHLWRVLAEWSRCVRVWCQLVTAVPATAMPPCQEQSDWERRKWREKRKTGQFFQQRNPQLSRIEIML